ncbi:hypothetical protein B296_00048050 [Ensete ventricosum]|uniref:Uncharacterized protein n=1 Tax=Ensete ventricosum TaxID=4639 RepID=A0A426YAT4_ENSVE|nr:hypothetical protein B296_00048050 [Ensete ventricosum]
MYRSANRPKLCGRVTELAGRDATTVEEGDQAAGVTSVDAEGVTREWVGEGELPKERTQSEVTEALRSNVATKEAKKNRIDVSPATGWRRSCMGVTACLSMDQGKLLKEHRGIEAGSRKRRGSDDESRGAQLPKSKASNQKECGLEGVPQCRISGSTDRKKRDADARQRIGGS